MTSATAEVNAGMADWVGGLGNLGAAMPDAPTNIAPADPPQQPPKPTEKPAPEPSKPPEKPAPAAPVEKTTEPAPDGKDETKWPRTAAEWKKYNESHKTVLNEKRALEDERNKLTKELEELRKKPIAPSDYEQIKKDREDLDRRLREIAIERHPKFNELYDTKTKAVIERAKGAVNQDRAADLERILKLPEGEYRDAQLEELMADLPPLKQGRLAAALNDLAAVNSEREAELSKSRENWQRMQQEEQAQAQQMAQQVQTFVDSTLAGIKSGDADLGAFLDDSGVAISRQVVLSPPSDEKDAANRIRIAAQGVAYPHLLQAMIGQKGRIAELEAKVAELTAAVPRAGNGGGDAPVQDAPPKSASPADQVAWWMKGLAQQ